MTKLTKTVKFVLLIIILIVILCVLCSVILSSVREDQKIPNYNIYEGYSVKPFGQTSYECTGTCYCENENSRRFTSTLGKRGLSAIFTAVSSVVAFSMAMDFFEDECENQYFGSDCSIVTSEIESCNSIHDDDEEEEQDLMSDERIKKPEKCVLCIGDSLTNGYTFLYPDNPEKYNPYSTVLQNMIDEDSENFKNSYTVTSFGVTGECTKEMVPRCEKLFDEINEEMDVSHVIIWGGGNDCLNSIESDEVVRNMQCMYTHCLKKDDVIVFAVRLPEHEWDFYEKNKRGTLGRKKEYNQGMKNVCDELERIHLIDVGDWTEMTEEEKKKYWEEDKLHFSKDGSANVARNIYEILKNHL